jgi:hypothetical protein
MTVAELLAELQPCDPDSQVVVYFDGPTPSLRHVDLVDVDQFEVDGPQVIVLELGDELE